MGVTSWLINTSVLVRLAHTPAPECGQTGSSRGPFRIAELVPPLAERLPLTIAEIDAMSDPQIAEFMRGTAEEARRRGCVVVARSWTFREPSMPARYSAIDQHRGGLWDTSPMGAASFLRVTRC